VVGGGCGFEGVGFMDEVLGSLVSLMAVSLRSGWEGGSWMPAQPK
jgi:hypothetical protein